LRSRMHHGMPVMDCCFGWSPEGILIRVLKSALVNISPTITPSRGFPHGAANAQSSTPMSTRLLVHLWETVKEDVLAHGEELIARVEGRSEAA
jgi:hypothetical protein